MPGPGVRPLIVGPAALAAACGAVPAPEPSPVVGDSAAVAAATAPRFSSWNPRLEVVELPAVHAVEDDDGRPSAVYALAHAFRADQVFDQALAEQAVDEALKDEVFGVFALDLTSGELSETLGFIPTCRWMDCEARIVDASADSVAVEWVGMTYGDQAGGATFRPAGLDDWRVLPGERVGPVGRATSERELADQFGADLVPGEVHIGEGFCSPGAVLFPDSPNRLEIVWTDSTRSVPARVEIEARGGDWRTSDGLFVGMSLTELEALRGGTIGFSGFGWDYGGGTGWSVEGAPLGLRLGYSRQREREAADDPRFGEILGDREVRSDHPLIRRMDVRVEGIYVSWRSPGVEEFCG